MVMICYSIYSDVKEKFCPLFLFETEKEAAKAYLDFMKSVPYEDKHLYELWRIGNFSLEEGDFFIDKEKVDVSYYSECFEIKEEN